MQIHVTTPTQPERKAPCDRFDATKRRIDIGRKIGQQCHPQLGGRYRRRQCCVHEGASTPADRALMVSFSSQVESSPIVPTHTSDRRDAMYSNSSGKT